MADDLVVPSRAELRMKIRSLSTQRDEALRSASHLGETAEKLVAQLAAMTEERDNWRKAHRETFDRLTRLCADLQQEINDRAAREEKLRKALTGLLDVCRCTNGCAPDDMTCATNVALAALSPTDTKEPGR